MIKFILLKIILISLTSTSGLAQNPVARLGIVIAPSLEKVTNYYASPKISYNLGIKYSSTLNNKINWQSGLYLLNKGYKFPVLLASRSPQMPNIQINTRHYIFLSVPINIVYDWNKNSIGAGISYGRLVKSLMQIRSIDANFFVFNKNNFSKDYFSINAVFSREFCVLKRELRISPILMVQLNNAWEFQVNSLEGTNRTTSILLELEYNLTHY